MVDEVYLTSADGTRLGLRRWGGGEPVVLVHGTMGTSADWSQLAGLLAETFTVHAVDRRGRGLSADGPVYTIEREVDDVRAVIEACDGPVHLVGHSFGAILALLVAMNAGAELRSLVLYEPPIGDSSGDGTDLATDLERLVATDRLDDAVARFAGAANDSDDHLDGASPALRAALREAVRSASREIRSAAAILPFDPEAVQQVQVPCLVLLGDQQHLATYNGVAELAEALPKGQLALVPGQHLAILFEPEAVAAQITPFLATRPPTS